MSDEYNIETSAQFLTWIDQCTASASSWNPPQSKWLLWMLTLPQRCESVSHPASRFPGFSSPSPFLCVPWGNSLCEQLQPQVRWGRIQASSSSCSFSFHIHHWGTRKCHFRHHQPQWKCFSALHLPTLSPKLLADRLQRSAKVRYIPRCPLR